MAEHRVSLEDLGELQRVVMETVWKLGQATVHDVRERLAPERELAYTTVLTVMQKLERAGWLRHRSEGRSYVYEPAVSRQQAGGGSLRRVLSGVFRGDALLLFQSLLREKEMSDEELDALRKMIDQKKKEGRRRE